MSEHFVGWYTTAPHPWKKAHRHGADQGQIGWKLHAVVLKHEREDCDEGFRPQALCGLTPRHGWGVDLFIEDECSRCVAAMGRREAAGDVFVNVHEKRRKEREAAELAAAQAEREPDYEWPFPKDRCCGRGNRETGCTDCPNTSGVDPVDGGNPK